MKMLLRLSGGLETSPILDRNAENLLITSTDVNRDVLVESRIRRVDTLLHANALLHERVKNGLLERSTKFYS